MKKYALIWAVCCAIFYSLPTNAFAQEGTKQTDIKPLIGTYWMPKQHKGERTKLGFQFADEKQISGSDGCNNFHVEYAYSPSKGFKLGRATSTELHCPNQKKFFDVYFLSQCQSYALDGKKLTFYDKEDKEVIVLYSELVIDTTPEKPTDNNLIGELILLGGEWKLESTTHPSFAMLVAKNVDFRLLLGSTDENFVAFFTSKTNGKKVFNQYLSTYTTEEANIKIASNNAFPMKKLGKKRPYCKDVLEGLLNVTTWEMSAGKLIIRSDSHTFTWTR
jgi:heat shock protein HslJ